MPKRIIVVSDMHCGHVAGLTPPQWQLAEVEEDVSSTKRNKWARLQRELWTHFVDILEQNGPFDHGFSLGDNIDGKGAKSGGSELITADREEQCDMAAYVHNQIRYKYGKGEAFDWVGVYGTAYHVGAEEDWETIVAERAGFKKLGSHESVDVNGCIFDLRHFTSNSSIPHGIFTPIAKERLWNALWAERDLRPRANVLLRGHVHRYADCGQTTWRAMSLPALQGMGSKFGARVCQSIVDWGVVIFDVEDDGRFTFCAKTIQIEAQKMKTIKL